MADESLAPLFDDPEEQRAYEEFCANQERGLGKFELAEPALVCRWRMARRSVPLLNRHIRALSQRLVNGAPLTTNMLSWAKQHVEWSLAAGDYRDPNGVLMTVIDINGDALMSVGPYEPLADASAAALIARAREAAREAEGTRVAPESLCTLLDGELLIAAGEYPCGAMTLVEQLATTRGLGCRRIALDELAGAVHGGQLLLVSDEHGVVLASDSAPEARDAETAAFIQKGVAKLFA